MTKVGVNENYCAWLHHHSFLPFVQREKILVTCLLSQVCQIFFTTALKMAAKIKVTVSLPLKLYPFILSSVINIVDLLTLWTSLYMPSEEIADVS